MLLNSFAAFAVVLRFAFFLHVKFDLNPSVTPLVSLAVLVDISIIAGMFNLLMPGVVFAYGLAVISLVWSVYRYKAEIKSKVMDFLTPGVIMFIVASVAIILFMFARKPLMTEWDEFSFWGISQKLVKIHGALYTFYKSSMIGNSTPPALAVLSYFFQWATPAFAEWASFAAYDVMFFACFSALTSCFDKDNWHMAFFVFLYGFVNPFIFEIYTRIIFLEKVYICTYADIPLGIVFFGAFAVYFFTKQNDERTVLPVLPILVLLTMIKDMGMALSCIVLFMAFFDMLVRHKEYKFLIFKGLLAKMAAAFVMLITTAATYFSWSFHMSRVMQRNPFELGGETNMSMVGMLVTGVKELLGIIPRSYKFTTILGYMIDAFFKVKISMIGAGVIVVSFITAIFIAAFILNDKAGRVRVVVLYITSWISFIGYYVFHIFLYVYIFKDNGYDLVSYNRYIYPFYMGWLSLAIMVLCLGAIGKKNKLSKLAIIAVSLLLFADFTRLASFDNIFVECNDRSFVLRKDVRTNANFVRDVIADDDVLFIFSGDDNGERWFIYTYEFAENIVAEDLWTNTEGMSADEAILARQKTLYDICKKNGVTNIFIDNSSVYIIENFGSLFDSDISYIGKDSAAYYKVNYEDDWFNFTLVKGGRFET